MSMVLVIVSLANYGDLIIVGFFCNKLILANFCTVWLVPVMITNLHSWEQMDNSRVHKVRFFCGATKPT